ncbi:MAG: DNA polymerase III subunit gamma/tau [Gemmatimonadaceae bacterium]|nr:DNA polymerase III subunit gamma/tau [Gemmatimonadaceae bacterium]
MIALARKYRPRNFATVAVQSHVSNTLKGAIARGRVAHGYLLCGPRGVGKTTLARVLAMALNCENKRPDGEPCGECTSCTRIWSGGASLDVVEIDAASNRGVDDARELRERAMYAPSGEGRYKVYIVDEAHMLTREAWNALLKILEEPPPRVVFVFATTEPQKIAQAAAPVLSRLQRFDFRRMGPGDIRERVGAVLAEEGVEAESEALGMIARAADGSMRDALSLTDQVLALGDGGVTALRVREALGLVAEDEYIALLDVIAERRAGDVFTMVGRLVELGVDLGQFLAGLGDILRAQLALALGAKEVDVSAAAREALVARKDRLGAGDLLRMLNAVAELEPRFRRSGQQQLLLETLLVRFALLDRTLDLEAVLREVGSGGGGSAGGGTPAPRPQPAPRSAPAGGESRGGYRAGPPTAGDSAPAPERLPRPELRRDMAVDTPRVQERIPAPPGEGPPSRGGTPARGGAPTRGERPSSPRMEAGPGLEAERGGTATMAPPSVVAELPESVAVQLASPPSGVNGGSPAVASFASLTSLDINHLVERWDDILAAIRRERPLVGTLLERAIPTAVAASGVVSLQMEETGAFENLAAKAKELTAALTPHIPGLVRVQLLPPAHARDSGPRRMTAESIKSETLVALRKKDAVLAAAIDELDLDLIS